MSGVEAASPLPVASTDAGAVGFVTALLVLLMLIPAQLVVGSLGAAGTPAELLAVTGLAWWLVERVAGPALAVRRPVHRPTAVALTALTLAALCSYVAGTTRPISAVEVRAGDRGLLSLAACAGALLLVAAGVTTREQLDLLLRRLVMLGGIIAGVGVVQFGTGVDVTRWIAVPGLSRNGDTATLLLRGGLHRPSATAMHPIEFGVVMAMILPIALHYAVHGDRRRRAWRWAAVGAIAAGVLTSVSRSAILGVFVALLFLLPAWPTRRRVTALFCLPFVVVIAMFAAPGLIGTILKLFTGISSDSSASSRTGDFTIAGQFISQRPWFGRGIGTFLPSYRILDNQYLGTLIDMGIVGAVALLAVFVTGIVAARRAAKAQADATAGELGHALAAAIVVPTVAFATFDALSFPMCATLTFFLVGCAGAYARLHSRPTALVHLPPGAEAPRARVAA